MQRILIALFTALLSSTIVVADFYESPEGGGGVSYSAGAENDIICEAADGSLEPCFTGTAISGVAGTVTFSTPSGSDLVIDLLGTDDYIEIKGPASCTGNCEYMFVKDNAGNTVVEYLDRPSVGFQMTMYDFAHALSGYFQATNNGLVLGSFQDDVTLDATVDIVLSDPTIIDNDLASGEAGFTLNDATSQRYDITNAGGLYGQSNWYYTGSLAGSILGLGAGVIELQSSSLVVLDAGQTTGRIQFFGTPLLDSFTRTIATGAIDSVNSWVTQIEGEGGLDDTLVTINQWGPGAVLAANQWFRLKAGGETITLDCSDGAGAKGAGNLDCKWSDSDITLQPGQFVDAMHDGTNFVIPNTNTITVEATASNIFKVEDFTDGEIFSVDDDEIRGKVLTNFDWTLADYEDWMVFSDNGAARLTLDNSGTLAGGAGRIIFASGIAGVANWSATVNSSGAIIYTETGNDLELNADGASDAVKLDSGTGNINLLDPTIIDHDFGVESMLELNDSGSDRIHFVNGASGPYIGLYTSAGTLSGDIGSFATGEVRINASGGTEVVQLGDNQDNIRFHGRQQYSIGSSTISLGAITHARTGVALVPEGGSPGTDTLTTINGGADGYWAVYYGTGTDEITFDCVSGAGNLSCENLIRDPILKNDEYSTWWYDSTDSKWILMSHNMVSAPPKIGGSVANQDVFNIVDVDGNNLLLMTETNSLGSDFKFYDAVGAHTSTIRSTTAGLYLYSIASGDDIWLDSADDIILVDETVIDYDAASNEAMLSISDASSLRFNFFNLNGTTGQIALYQSGTLAGVITADGTAGIDLGGNGYNVTMDMNYGAVFSVEGATKFTSQSDTLAADGSVTLQHGGYFILNSNGGAGVADTLESITASWDTSAGFQAYFEAGDAQITINCSTSPTNIFCPATGADIVLVKGEVALCVTNYNEGGTTEWMCREQG